ncbi:hypothetical protein Acr_00g0054840 [Actinidia rufa]|uniref:Uncharacterized protein n=1 Tax=Actinidia rufa TaxID=165716 RepID=A0A7J0DLS0_9ERIC|nr:hypothetical protein Acr_00g0054840 [Actinidia rufa]
MRERNRNWARNWNHMGWDNFFEAARDWDWTGLVGATQYQSRLDFTDRGWTGLAAQEAGGCLVAAQVGCTGGWVGGCGCLVAQGLHRGCAGGWVGACLVAQGLRRRLGWWLSGCAGAAQEAGGCLVAAQVAVKAAQEAEGGGCVGGYWI